MKGGSEAQESNRVLGQIIRGALASVDASCIDAVQMVETREDVQALLALDEYIDLFIPRGSNAFVRYIQEHTRVPVLGTLRVCAMRTWTSTPTCRGLSRCVTTRRCNTLPCATPSRRF